MGLVLHDLDQRVLGDEIIHASGLPASSVINAREMQDPETLERLHTLHADVRFSAFFAHILKPQMLSLFPRGVVNVDPAGDLIDKLRALSSPPIVKGAYFETPSGRVWVQISLDLENG